MTSGSAAAVGAAAASAGAADFFGLRHDHVDEHHVHLADRRPLRVGGDVAHAHALVQHQLADVDLDVLRNVARQALDLDLAADELEDAALLLDALRLALDDDRNRDLEDAVHRDAVEVGVQHWCVTGSSWYSFTSTFVSPPPGSFSEISVLAPDSE